MRGHEASGHSVSWFDLARFSNSANAATFAELWKASFGFFTLCLGIYVVTLKPDAFFLHDLQHFIVGYDFLNLWMAGKLSLSDNPAQYYEANHYADALTTVLGKGHPDLVLSYPPIQFLLGLPFGLLPYSIAYIAWIALNLLALRVALKGLFPCPLFLLLLVSPAAFIWLICGQSSLITTALMIGALRLLPRAPWKAGICIGLLVIKPQLAILFPLLLLMTGQWRSFIAASLTVILVVGITYAWLGPDPWVSYYNFGIPEHVSLFVHPTDLVTSLTPTVFNDLLVIGTSTHIAFAVQTVLGIVATLALIIGLRRSHDPSYRWLLFTTASTLATYYMLSYDLVPFVAALLFFLMNHPIGKRSTYLFVACFCWPLLDFVLNAYHIPGPSLLPLILLGWLLFNAPLRSIHAT